MTWTNPVASNDILWATSVTNVSCGTGNNDAPSVTVPAIPNSSASHNAWFTWYQTFVGNYVTACTAASADTLTEPNWQGCDVSTANKDQDFLCLGNFGWAVMRNMDGLLPKVRWAWSNMVCDNNGCAAPVAAAASIAVDGVDFPGNPALAPTHYSPDVEGQFVRDQWVPIAGGNGGTLATRYEESRSYDCSDVGNNCSAAAMTANAWVECGSSNRTIIKFLPTATAGKFNAVFNDSTEVRFGKYRGGAVDDTNAYDICVGILAAKAAPEFMATATKLN